MLTEILKSKRNGCPTGTYDSLTENEALIANLALKITKILTEENNLNLRQANAVLELVQAKIEECKLVY